VSDIEYVISKKHTLIWESVSMIAMDWLI